MDNLIYTSSSSFSINSKTIHQKKTIEDKGVVYSKIILSIATFSLVTNGVMNVHSIKPQQKDIDMPNVEMESVSFFSTETNISSQDFTNIQSKNDIISMNNDVLEVEDLTDRVTQAQLNEIKEHFDTKLNSLQQQLSTQIDQAKTATITEINQTIRNEHKELKNAKVSKFRFWVGSVLVPFAVAALTLYFSQFLKK